jgi:hypothetical protein
MFRFNAKLPRLPDVPRVTDAQLDFKCRQLPTTDSHLSSYYNGLTPLYKLDTVLFFASYQQQQYNNLFSVPATSVFGGSVPDTVASYEYKVISSKSSAASSTFPQNQITSTTVFSVSDVTDGINFDLLRTLFLALDVLVLVYRMTRTCYTVRILRRRFTRCRCRRLTDVGGASSLTMAAAATVNGDIASSSVSSGYQRQQPTCCLADGSNIYSDPQTLSLRHKLSNKTVDEDWRCRNNDLKPNGGKFLCLICCRI